MSPRREQALQRALWSGSVLLLLSSAAVGAMAIRESRGVRPFLLEEGATSSSDPGTSNDRENALGLLRGKQMSRPVVKVIAPPPPPPPKPPIPPLETLIRLSGIMSFGKDAPKEAFIEMKSTNQTKPYKAGDVLSTGGIKIKSITDVVIVSYDEKEWKLTDRGAEALPLAPLVGPGTKE